MQTNSKAIGIDLGTTNSVVAILDTSDREMVLHRDPGTKRATTPSCVWKDPRPKSEKERFVVGTKALNRIGSLPAPVRSIKRLMGRRTKVLLTDEEVTPEEVSKHILLEMKRQIEEDVARFPTSSGSWIADRAIITIPAYFDTPAAEATKIAGEMANLGVLQLLHEPTAAATYYCWKHRIQDGVFLVYDLGGGTFDVSVIRCTAGAFEVLGVSGNNFLGGDDADTIVAEKLLARLGADYALDLDFSLDADGRPRKLEDRLRFERFRFLGETVKKQLSTADDFLLRDQNLQDQNGQTVIIETPFERAELEEWFLPLIERTFPYCGDALAKAYAKGGVALKDIDNILLVGGMTHVPLVRKLVRERLCADSGSVEPRARCAEPWYDPKSVDTMVALGAAICAAEDGGLHVYNDAKSVRVCFRGSSLTDRIEAPVGGQVETVEPGPGGAVRTAPLQGGAARLRLDDTGFDAEVELTDGGSFAFRRVPLQRDAENLLRFEILDGGGAVVAAFTRLLTHSSEAVRRRVPPPSIAKPLFLEVLRDGKTARKCIVPPGQTLPLVADYNFSHPGDVELIRLTIFQNKRVIKVILVPVPFSLPRGTPVPFNIQVDKYQLITIKGKIGDVPFEAMVEAPPDRRLPPGSEVEALDRAFHEAIEYLPAGKRNLAEVKYDMARHSYDACVSRGDEPQAINNLEEMEEIVAECARTEGVLQPPKQFLDDLVRECHEYNQAVIGLAARARLPHDEAEIQRAIETQRIQGEKAFTDAKQTAYSDALVMLESIRNHLIIVGQKAIKATGGGRDDPRTAEQKALDNLKVLGQEIGKAGEIARAKRRPDLHQETVKMQAEIESLHSKLPAQHREVTERAGQISMRLEQMMNVLIKLGDGESGPGTPPEDHEP